MSRRTTSLAGVLTLLLPLAFAWADGPQDPAAVDLNNRGIEAARAGRFEEGIALVRQAVQQAPADAQFRRNLSGMLTDWAVELEERGRLQPAVAALDEAMDLDPQNGAALVRRGNLAYLAESDPANAVTLWKRAYGLLPSAVQAALAKQIGQAERDQAIERTFTARDTAHFRILFDGPQHAQAAERLEPVLEDAHKRLTELLHAPPSRLTVLLYSSDGFQRVAGRRDWAFGLYDGRIRLRIDELEQMDVVPIAVAHELGHAYLAETYGPALPTWLHEGFAQWVEPPSEPTPQQAMMLEAIRTRSAWVPLKWLDRRFSQPSHVDDVDRAYVQSRFVVERLITRYGTDRWLRFLRAIQGGTPVDEATSAAFGVPWSRIDQGSFD